MNSAAANTGAHVTLRVPAFTPFGHMPRSGTAGSFCAFNSVFNYVNYAMLFSTVAALFYSHTSSVQEFQFLHILTLIIFQVLFCFILFCFVFDNNHHEVVSHCGFGLHFPND